VLPSGTRSRFLNCIVVPGPKPFRSAAGLYNFLPITRSELTLHRKSSFSIQASDTLNSYQTMQSSDNASVAPTSPYPGTPPPSPTLLHLNETVTVKLLQKTFIETIKAVQKSADPAESPNSSTGPSETDKTGEARKGASKLEVKSVLELCVFPTYSTGQKLNHSKMG
jgi:hypothetical protein